MSRLTPPSQAAMSAPSSPLRPGGSRKPYHSATPPPADASPNSASASTSMYHPPSTGSGHVELLSPPNWLSISAPISRQPSEAGDDVGNLSALSVDDGAHLGGTSAVSSPLSGTSINARRVSGSSTHIRSNSEAIHVMHNNRSPPVVVGQSARIFQATHSPIHATTIPHSHHAHSSSFSVTSSAAAAATAKFSPKYTSSNTSSTSSTGHHKSMSINIVSPTASSSQVQPPSASPVPPLHSGQPNVHSPLSARAYPHSQPGSRRPSRTSLSMGQLPSPLARAESPSAAAAISGRTPIISVVTGRASPSMSVNQSPSPSHRNSPRSKPLAGPTYGKESQTKDPHAMNLGGSSGNNSGTVAPVQVFCRFRPCFTDESVASDLVSIAHDSQSVCVVSDLAEKTDSGRAASSPQHMTEFKFQHVFQPDATQEQVYDRLISQGVPPTNAHLAEGGSSVLDALFRGVNATVLAYGQTGTGKTWSMEGPTASMLAAMTSSTSDAVSTDLDSVFNLRGLIPRLIENIFRRLQEQHEQRTQETNRGNAPSPNVDGSVTPTAAAASSPSPIPPGAMGSAGNSVSVQISFFELYRNKIRDLLAGGSTMYDATDEEAINNPTPSPASSSDRSTTSTAASPPTPQNKPLQLQIKDKQVVVVGLTEKYLFDSRSVLKALKEGQRYRTVARTNANPFSSRGHAIFDIFIRQTTSTGKINPQGQFEENVTVSRLRLVDLAGSEQSVDSGVDANRLLEAQSINRSLTFLGQVITSLSQGKKHINYRDSLLTRVMSQSLGGNSVTLLLITASASKAALKKTLNTLRFGAVASNILNAIIVNTKKKSSAYGTMHDGKYITGMNFSIPNSAALAQAALVASNWEESTCWNRLQKLQKSVGLKAIPMAFIRTLLGEKKDTTTSSGKPKTGEGKDSTEKAVAGAAGGWAPSMDAFDQLRSDLSDPKQQSASLRETMDKIEVELCSLFHDLARRKYLQLYRTSKPLSVESESSSDLMDLYDDVLSANGFDLATDGKNIQAIKLLHRVAQKIKEGVVSNKSLVFEQEQKETVERVQPLASAATSSSTTGTATEDQSPFGNSAAAFHAKSNPATSSFNSLPPRSPAKRSRSPLGVTSTSSTSSSGTPPSAAAASTTTEQNPSYATLLEKLEKAQLLNVELTRKLQEKARATLARSDPDSSLAVIDDELKQQSSHQQEEKAAAHLQLHIQALQSELDTSYNEIVRVNAENDELKERVAIMFQQQQMLYQQKAGEYLADEPHHLHEPPHTRQPSGAAPLHSYPTSQQFPASHPRQTATASSIGSTTDSTSTGATSPSKSVRSSAHAASSSFPTVASVSIGGNTDNTISMNTSAQTYEHADPELASGSTSTDSVRARIHDSIPSSTRTHPPVAQNASLTSAQLHQSELARIDLERALSQRDSEFDEERQLLKQLHEQEKVALMKLVEERMTKRQKLQSEGSANGSIDETQVSAADFISSPAFQSLIAARVAMETAELQRKTKLALSRAANERDAYKQTQPASTIKVRRSRDEDDQDDIEEEEEVEDDEDEEFVRPVTPRPISRQLFSEVSHPTETSLPSEAEQIEINAQIIHDEVQKEKALLEEEYRLKQLAWIEDKQLELEQSQTGPSFNSPLRPVVMDAAELAASSITSPAELRQSLSQIHTELREEKMDFLRKLHVKLHDEQRAWKEQLLAATPANGRLATTERDELLGSIARIEFETRSEINNLTNDFQRKLTSHHRALADKERRLQMEWESKRLQWQDEAIAEYQKSQVMQSPLRSAGGLESEKIIAEEQALRQKQFETAEQSFQVKLALLELQSVELNAKEKSAQIQREQLEKQEKELSDRLSDHQQRLTLLLPASQAEQQQQEEEERKRFQVEAGKLLEAERASHAKHIEMIKIEFEKQLETLLKEKLKLERETLLKNNKTDQESWMIRSQKSLDQEFQQALSQEKSKLKSFYENQLNTRSAELEKQLQASVSARVEQGKAIWRKEVEQQLQKQFDEKWNYQETLHMTSLKKLLDEQSQWEKKFNDREKQFVMVLTQQQEKTAVQLQHQQQLQQQAQQQVSAMSVFQHGSCDQQQQLSRLRLEFEAKYLVDQTKLREEFQQREGEFQKQLKEHLSREYVEPLEKKNQNLRDQLEMLELIHQQKEHEKKFGADTLLQKATATITPLSPNRSVNSSRIVVSPSQPSSSPVALREIVEEKEEAILLSPSRSSRSSSSPSLLSPKALAIEAKARWEADRNGHISDVGYRSVVEPVAAYESQQQQMNKQIQHLEQEMAALRTARESPVHSPLPSPLKVSFAAPLSTVNEIDDGEYIPNSPSSLKKKKSSSTTPTSSKKKEDRYTVEMNMGDAPRKFTIVTNSSSNSAKKPAAATVALPSPPASTVTPVAMQSSPPQRNSEEIIARALQLSQQSFLASQAQQAREKLSSKDVENIVDRVVQQTIADRVAQYSALGVSAPPAPPVASSHAQEEKLRHLESELKHAQASIEQLTNLVDAAIPTSAGEMARSHFQAPQPQVVVASPAATISQPPLKYFSPKFSQAPPASGAIAATATPLAASVINELHSQLDETQSLISNENQARLLDGATRALLDETAAKKAEILRASEEKFEERATSQAVLDAIPTPPLSPIRMSFSASQSTAHPPVAPAAQASTTANILPSHHNTSSALNSSLPSEPNSSFYSSVSRVADPLNDSALGVAALELQMAQRRTEEARWRMQNAIQQAKVSDSLNSSLNSSISSLSSLNSSMRSNYNLPPSTPMTSSSFLHVQPMSATAINAFRLKPTGYSQMPWNRK